jgi:hypothetical protein
MTAEAGLLHFRGAFHNPLMTLPVTLPPVGAMLMASAAAGSSGGIFGLRAGGCDTGLIAHDNLSLLHNGFAWNRNGSEFLLAHSHEHRIYAFEFDVERGELGRTDHDGLWRAGLARSLCYQCNTRRACAWT